MRAMPIPTMRGTAHGPGVGGGGVLDIMHGLSRVPMDPRSPVVRGGGTRIHSDRTFCTPFKRTPLVLYLVGRSRGM